jgi:hypothetical protein
MNKETTKWARELLETLPPEWIKLIPERFWHESYHPNEALLLVRGKDISRIQVQEEISTMRYPSTVNVPQTDIFSVTWPINYDKIHEFTVCKRETVVKHNKSLIVYVDENYLR